MKFLFNLIFGLTLIINCNNVIIANPIDVNNNNTTTNQNNNNSADTSNMSYNELMQAFVNAGNNIHEALQIVHSNINNNNLIQLIIDIFAVSTKFLESNYQMNFFIQSFIENNDKNNEVVNIKKYLKHKDDVTYDIFQDKIDIEKEVDISLLLNKGINISANNQSNTLKIMDELCKIHLKEALEQNDKNKLKDIITFLKVKLNRYKKDATNNLETIKNMSSVDKDRLKYYLLHSNFKNIMKHINIVINNTSSVLQSIGNVSDNFGFDIINSMIEYFKVEKEYLQELGIVIQIF